MKVASYLPTRRAYIQLLPAARPPAEFAKLAVVRSVRTGDALT
jgi:hypothetical protein